MELTDPNGHTKQWEKVSLEEFESGIVKDLNKENSKTTIELLKDFQEGINCTTKGRRTAGSLLRLRMNMRLLGLEIKSKPYNSLTREQLSNICKKKDSENFTRNVKVIYNWLFRTGRIKENIADHIVVDDYSKGKPNWVYLDEIQMKTLINTLNANYRAIVTFMYDSGIRPSECWKIRIMDFKDDFKVLNIPKIRSNGERVSKTFERTIKLKLCSSLIKEYVSFHNLSGKDLLMKVGQAGFKKELRNKCKKLFGTQPTEARESPDKITATDIRHISACFWNDRYKTNKSLMYRFGWKKEDKVFYYSEFKGSRDKIDDDDLITQEDKTKYEKDIQELKKNQEHLARTLQVMTPNPTVIEVNGQKYVSSTSGLTHRVDDKPQFIPYDTNKRYQEI